MEFRITSASKDILGTFSDYTPLDQLSLFSSFHRRRYAGQTPVNLPFNRLIDSGHTATLIHPAPAKDIHPLAGFRTSGVCQFFIVLTERH